MGDDYLLDDVWTLYFHDPNDPSWTTQSYVRVADVSSGSDYASVSHALTGKIIHGMFFLMRDPVYPCWDDKYNIDGGCASIKISKKDAERFWDEMCIRLLSEALYVPSPSLSSSQKENKDEETGSSASPPCVNGISISSKPLHSIVKVWMTKDASQSPTDVVRRLLLPEGVIGDVIFRYNREFIGMSQTRAQQQ